MFNNIHIILEPKKWNIKIILLSIFTIIIILYAIDFFYSINDLKSSSCPPGQIMSSWNDHEKRGITDIQCSYPKICPIGKKLTANCGALFDGEGGYSSCTTVCQGEDDFPMVGKPVIYLYPKEKTDVEVTLNFKGKLIASYPEYNSDTSGWNIVVYPDSKIINKSDNKEYSYLFWEGIPKEEIDWEMNKGFIVKGSDSREFLQKILPKVGLTPKEYNEFIVYWYPIMQKNKYNLIHFAGNQYTNLAPLKTQPKYDSLLRVFMIIKPIEKPVNIEPQLFEPFNRNGFTVVEWGGTILKK